MLSLLAPQSANAHFPWLALDDEGKPILFFGEGLDDRTYHLPESMSQFELKHAHSKDQTKPLQLQPVSTDDLVGLRSAHSVKPTGCIYGTQTYGVYHGSKLVYYVQHFPSLDPATWTTGNIPNKLRAKVTADKDGIQVSVFWQEKPLSDAEVKLFCDEGHEEGSAKTDENGVVTFTNQQVEPGLNAILVGFTDKQASGTFKEQSFQATSNYLTVTFPRPQINGKANHNDSAHTRESKMTKSNESSVAVKTSSLPELPTELTSFGGTVANGTLFVYGGHVGNAHSYSTAEQSNAFWSLDLPDGASWNSLPSGPKLQGLAMVGHGNSVVRIGGFTALNDEGETHNLQSQATVSRYDIDAKQWKDDTPLPEPRSSHAATVIGNQVYVVGGWAMSGENETQWHNTAWTADLSQQPLQWKPIAAPPFKRRALSVAAHDGRVYVVGGMDQEQGPSTEVDIFDPKSNQWSKGASLIGEAMTGFGCWAQSHAGHLYVSTVNGTIQRLTDEGDDWEIVGSYDPGRFFHCMLPLDPSSMVMVGGANMSIGRFTNLDIVEIK
ncbi:Kelch repeat type 1-containing protein [Rhodopirellula maiorica SM1]|uniref:Kelch repeat type 1-containing protein n=1 Tax=Rhodopirellula maiorica SM1 TaxID=1265738 RepID=M5RMC8_9BACT|nr:Kelch repeat type 1-containing protein [Rhodopirellula maiorica SM1]